MAIVGGLALCLIRLYVAPLRPVAIAADRVLPRHADLRAADVGRLCVARAVRLARTSSSPPAGWRSALQSSGYLAETFRAGIEAVPRGQREAAYSAGMSPPQTFRRIVHAAGRCSTSAPSIVNQFTVIVKSSTLVSVITVPDLMSQSQKLVNVWYEPIEILTATAAIYIAFVFLVSLAGKLSPTCCAGATGSRRRELCPLAPKRQPLLVSPAQVRPLGPCCPSSREKAKPSP